jgi:hypothetical protein
MGLPSVRHPPGLRGPRQNLNYQLCGLRLRPVCPCHRRTNATGRQLWPLVLPVHVMRMQPVRTSAPLSLPVHLHQNARWMVAPPFCFRHRYSALHHDSPRHCLSDYLKMICC